MIERLERRLSVRMAALSVLGTVLLGMGEQNFVLPLLVLAVAVTSVYFTDRKKVFRLNRHLASLAALAAVAFALIDYRQAERNLQLLAIANLLVYLQIVVFFQEKNPRNFWQLAMLSLLQVVVAAALNYSVIFGVLLAVYMFFGMSTLAMFFIYREALRYAAAQPPDPDATSTARTLAAQRDRELRRWPIQPGPLRLIGDDVNDVADRATQRGINHTAIRMGLGTVVLATLAFIFLPRFGSSPWRTGEVEAGRIVGFSDEVTLGALGEAIESPEVVMRVSFVDERDGKSIRLVGNPLLRGSVVVSYDPQTKRWRQAKPRGGAPFHSLSEPPDGQPLVRQEFALEPQNESVVFSIYPAYSDRPETLLVKYDTTRNQLFRPEHLQDNRVNFDLLTTGIREDRQRKIVPARVYEYRKGEDTRLLIVPAIGERDPFPGLRAEARRIIEEEDVPDHDTVAKARALEAFFLYKGGFAYSLTGQQRQAGIDPIEDFVTTNRRGHCEYFASALTLMLRSQGIPARMVIGFRGGEWNSLGRFYQFRQLHAHTWVEVFLEQSELIERGRRAEEFRNGGWLALDPTTATMDDGSIVAATNSTGLYDYVEMLWISNVVSFSKQFQQEKIYGPIVEGAKQGANTTIHWLAQYMPTDDKPARGVLGGLYRGWRWLKQNWLSARGLLVITGLIAALYVLALSIRWLLPRIVRKLRRRIAPALAREHREVEFYQRFEKLLAANGLRRLAAQTQREFASTAEAKMEASPETTAVARYPASVVAAFYAVRFGEEDLDAEELRAVEAHLRELERSLKQPQPATNGQ